MNFEIVGEITDVETISVGSSIWEVARLRRAYWQGQVAEAQRRGASALGQW